MPKNNPTEKVDLSPGGLLPPFPNPDDQVRDTFIGIGLRAMIEHQLTTKQGGQYDVAGDWAVRYANAAMISRAKLMTNLVVSRGQIIKVEAPEPPKLPAEPSPAPAPPPTAPRPATIPPSIAEQIGTTADPLIEV